MTPSHPSREQAESTVKGVLRGPNARWKLGLLALATVLVAVACATSPTGRRQVLLVPEAQLAEQGRAAFVQMKGQVPLSTDAARTSYVRCVANAILRELKPSEVAGLAVTNWEVELFADDSANAFALPGGRIGVHTGLLDVAETPDQLAAVLGHEVAHVLARHGNARVSNSQIVQAGVIAGSIFLGGGDPAQQQQMLGLLGAGAQFGVLMPFSRGDESEADEIGLELMARAGFDPRQSVTLWQNMGRASGGAAPPEFMSTHPSHSTRISQLQALIPKMLPIYQRAQASGRRPNCR